MDPLYKCGPKELDTFIFQNLQPNEEFNEQVRKAINIICEFLKSTCFRDFTPPRPKVLKVVKGGSSGKGTALKGGSDADLVLFLNIFNGYEDQERDRGFIIQEIEKRLKECRERIRSDIEVRIEKPKWDNPRVLSFQLRSGDFTEEYIDFDVLPAFDALGHYRGGKPDPQVYIGLINSSRGQGGQFSPCFTELQRDFIRERPTKLKSLIRLVKYWYKQLSELRSKPPKYALELLAVYAWEQDGEKTYFDMAEGFRTVLWLIQQYRDLCIFWTKYYDFQNETLKKYLHTQLRKTRPVILDPADPTGNVGEGKRWDLLAEKAAKCATQKCFRKPDGSMVQPWNVPLQVPWEEPYSCTIL
uniref:2'-5' oligoadenylate synthase n=1 Tax=Podarcis muralis TaxID=64176 RepID=A0A670JJS9_PODMU|nr:2'-5'-oligoadenylate synthase 1A-like [Podarcis muralis]